jgi:hypothetical protein
MVGTPKTTKSKFHSRFLINRDLLKPYLSRLLYVSPIFFLAALHYILVPLSSLVPIIPLIVVAVVVVLVEDTISALFAGVLTSLVMVVPSPALVFVEFPELVLRTISAQQNLLLILAILAIGLIQGAIVRGLSYWLQVFMNTRARSSTFIESLVFVIGITAFIDDYFSYFSRAPLLSHYKNLPDSSIQKITSIIVLSSLIMPALLVMSTWGIFFKTLTTVKVNYIDFFGFELFPFPLFQFSVLMILFSMLMFSYYSKYNSSRNNSESSSNTDENEKGIESSFPFARSRMRMITFLCIAGILPYVTLFLIIFSFRSISDMFVLLGFIAAAPIVLIIVFFARIMNLYWKYNDEIEREKNQKIDIFKYTNAIVVAVKKLWLNLRNSVGQNIYSVVLVLIMLLVFREVMITQLKFDLFITEMISSFPNLNLILPLIVFLFAASLSMSLGSSFFALTLLIPLFQSVAPSDITFTSLILGAIMSGSVFGNAISEIGDVPTFHKEYMQSICSENQLRNRNVQLKHISWIAFGITMIGFSLSIFIKELFGLLMITGTLSLLAVVIDKRLR